MGAYPPYYLFIMTVTLFNDMVFTIGSVVFTIGLLPMAYSVYKGRIGIEVVPTATVTAIVLTIYCLNYWDIGSYIAAIPHTAIVWWYIALGSYINSRKSPESLYPNKTNT
jgi:hypothetical protein